jgi:hypothetical protein
VRNNSADPIRRVPSQEWAIRRFRGGRKAKPKPIAEVLKCYNRSETKILSSVWLDRLGFRFKKCPALPVALVSKQKGIRLSFRAPVNPRAKPCQPRTNNASQRRTKKPELLEAGEPLVSQQWRWLGVDAGGRLLTGGGYSPPRPRVACAPGDDARVLSLWLHQIPQFEIMSWKFGSKSIKHMTNSLNANG